MLTEKQFAKLCDSRPMVLRLCLRLTKREDVAEELAQEAFALAWRKRHQFRGDAKPSTWLYRITVNVCRVWRRQEVCGRRGGGRVNSLEEMQECFAHFDVAEPCERTETSLAQRELREQLGSLIRQFPGRERTVLVLRYYEELSFAEVASLLNLSVGAVKSYDYRARQRLRRRLLQHGLATA